MESRQRLLHWLYEREVQMAETIDELRTDLEVRILLRRLGRTPVKTVRPLAYRMRLRLPGSGTLRRLEGRHLHRKICSFLVVIMPMWRVVCQRAVCSVS